MIKTTIEQQCTVTSSKRVHLSERTNSGVPFYCSKEIIEKVNGTMPTETDFISEEQYINIKDKFGVPQPDDLLLTTRGTIGVPYLYRNNDKFYFADGNLTWLKDFKSTLSSKYLYYWFQTKEARKSLEAISKGTAQQALSIEGLKKLSVRIPDIKVQNRVCEIISSYDDLIENNQKQIKLLEEAAQRLYKEWFVDLRFPGYEQTKIVDGVPEGWKWRSVKDVIAFHDAKRKPLSSMERNSFKGKYRYFGAAGVLDYVAGYLFDGIYLLLGEDGTVITSDGYPVLQYVDGKFWVNNHAHILTGKNPFTTEYIFMMFKNLKVTDVVTGVAQPKISQERLCKKKIIVPSLQLVESYQTLCKPFFENILTLQQQITLLAEARDRLLPKLMNGEIEV